MNDGRQFCGDFHLLTPVPDTPWYSYECYDTIHLIFILIKLSHRIFLSAFDGKIFSTIHWFLIIHQPTIPSFSSLQQIHHHQPPEPSGKIEANSRNKDHKRGKTGICRGYSLPHYQALLGLALCCVYFSLFFFSLEPGGSSPLERKLLSACGHRGKCVIIIDGTPV